MTDLVTESGRWKKCAAQVMLSTGTYYWIQGDVEPNIEALTYKSVEGTDEASPNQHWSSVHG